MGSRNNLKFSKYKGKINNYLSAEGYNMKLAEKNLLVPR